MKLSSLFKTLENFSSSSSSSSSSPWPWPILPTCGNPNKTLSFRQENNHNIFKTLNSTFQLDDDTTSYISLDDFCSESQRSFSSSGDYIENVIQGLKLEKERLFFEPGETSSIILEESGNGLCCSDTLKMSSGTCSLKSLSKLGNNDTTTFVPFQESVVMTLDSKDPFVDFRESMEEMVEAHGVQDWENLEELLTCYLKVNNKSNHGYIVGAFVDLLVSLAFNHEDNGASTSSYAMATIDEENCCCVSSTTTSHSFTSPFSFCNSSTTSSTSTTSACLSSLLEDEIISERV